VTFTDSTATSQAIPVHSDEAYCVHQALTLSK